MRITVSTDNHIEGSDRLIAYVSRMMESTLSRFSVLITRVDIYLSDASGNKSSREDKRCLIKARLKGRRPVGSAHRATTLSMAIDGATEKLLHSLGSVTSRLQGHGTRESGGAHPPPSN